MNLRKAVSAALMITVLSGFLPSGCRPKIDNAKVKSLPIGTPIETVFDTLGQPKARGREVTLEYTGKMIKEYAEDLEVCLWEGERTYLLTFRKDILVEKVGIRWTKVSVRKSNADRMRAGDDILVRLVRDGAVFEGEEL